MNEKLKKILDALYRNPNDFQQACEKELCDPRIPDSSNFVSFLVNESTAIEYPYFYSIYKTFCQTTSGEMDAEVRKEIEELRKNTISIDVLKKECESLDDTTKNAFLNNLDIVAKNEKSLTVPIIAACLVTIATSENDKLDKFYEIATKLILAVAPSTRDASLDNSVIDNVLRQIEEHFDETIYNKTKAFLNSATIMNQLSATASTMETFCLTTKKDERMLRYYQNGEELPLITNESPLDPEPSIEDAIKTFDLNDNSNFLKYALEKIDDEVRKYFKDKGIDLKYAIPATEAVFLTLCHQLEKEVDDNVLFAISDPLSDFLYFSPFNEEILTSIKDICKEISGKEVEFGKEVKKPAEDKKTEVDDKKTESDASTQPTDNEQEIKEAVKKLKESFLKPNQPKSIQPAFSNAKEVIVSAHYTFVGSPVFGKKSKRLSYVTPAEQNLMGNLNIGQGEGTAAKILNNAMRALKSIYDNQKKQIKASREKLINNIKAGEVVSEDEIKRVNTAIECYNKSTDPKILLKAFSRMFKSGLQKESLVSEQYLDQFKEDHPELF